MRSWCKAAFDRVTAALVLLVVGPVLLLVGAVVLATSPGPALYRQQRVGRDGELFWLLKLRSMVQDADARQAELRCLNEAGEVLFKVRDDPRVTRVGRVLRTWSIDELPQLVNVLRGDMSLVGPRPGLPDEVARYTPEAHRRLTVRPGMTGLWQVSGRSRLSWDEMVRLDLQYVDTRSGWLDLRILARTVVCVLLRQGAY